MAPSNPAYTFPPCPTCNEPVECTDLDEGRHFPPGSIPVRQQLDYPDGLYVRMSQRADHGLGDRVGYPDIARDRLTLHPCEHHLDGGDAHRYNLAATNLTYPDLKFVITVEVPAELTGEHGPTLFSFTGITDPCDVIAEAALADGDPIVRRLEKVTELTRRALPHLRPAPHGRDRPNQPNTTPDGWPVVVGWPAVVALAEAYAAACCGCNIRDAVPVAAQAAVDQAADALPAFTDTTAIREYTHQFTHVQ